MVEEANIPFRDTGELRKEYYRRYGTTLQGLMAHHQVDPRLYMAYVHDVPIEELLDQDMELASMLSEIKAQRLIFTNSDRAHVERVLHALGIREHIDGIVDFFASDYRSKPDPGAYSRALEIAGNPDPHLCVLVDDRLRNLLPAKQLGMTMVWIGTGDSPSGVDYLIPNIKQLTLKVPGLKGD